MIFIAVRFQVLPEYREQWLPAVGDFTRAVREEPGNLWFDWSQSADDPNQFVLLEAFRDGEAGTIHVQSQHFKDAIQLMPTMLASTPRIINVEIPDRADWSVMGEMEVSEPRA